MIARKGSKFAFMAKGFGLPLGQRVKHKLGNKKLFKWAKLYRILFFSRNISYFEGGCKFWGVFFC